MIKTTLAPPPGLTPRELIAAQDLTDEQWLELLRSEALFVLLEPNQPKH